MYTNPIVLGYLAEFRHEEDIRERRVSPRALRPHFLFAIPHIVKSHYSTPKAASAALHTGHGQTPSGI